MKKVASKYASALFELALEQKLESRFIEDIHFIKDIISTLPFELTMAQKKVIKHITENIHEPKPMLRLLQ